MKIEQDRVQILSGCRFGYTLGGRSVQITKRLKLGGADGSAATAGSEEEGPPGPPEWEHVRSPRPGHADLAGALKYGHRDLRNVLERASAPERPPRRRGRHSKVLLRRFESTGGHVVRIGDVEAPGRGDLEAMRRG